MFAEYYIILLSSNILPSPSNYFVKMRSQLAAVRLHLRCGRIVAPLQDVAERTDELVEHAAIDSEKHGVSSLECSVARALRFSQEL